MSALNLGWWFLLRHRVIYYNTDLTSAEDLLTTVKIVDVCDTLIVCDTLTDGLTLLGYAEKGMFKLLIKKKKVSTLWYVLIPLFTLMMLGYGLLWWPTCQERDRINSGKLDIQTPRALADVVISTELIKKYIFDNFFCRYQKLTMQCRITLILFWTKYVVTFRICLMDRESSCACLIMNNLLYPGD